MNQAAWPTYCSPSGSFAHGTTRSTPSAPRPARRSHRRCTSSGVSSREPSGSGSSTKSFSVPCPFRKRTLSPYGGEGLGEQVGLGVEPGDAGVAAEPGALALHEPVRRGHGLRLRRLLAEHPVELRERLLVAQRLRRRHPVAEPV